MNERYEHIAKNIAEIRAQMALAAQRVGRDPAEITLIAASKTQDSDTIRAGIAAGLTVCGENRVQELLPHLAVDAYHGAAVHFIGHLQTNKVKQVVGAVSLIQSVDSERLLLAIDKEAEKQGLVQDVLLEVNIGHEENKGGLLPEAVLPTAAFTGTLPSVRLRGLMCIPPAEGTNTQLRGFFAQMRQLFVDTANEMGDNKSVIDCLSMGMSGDFALAIEEGSTMIRVGTALFGARPPLR